MALYECMVGNNSGGESGFDETVLWTNSSPMGLGTTVLSGNISDYDFLKITWAYDGNSGSRRESMYIPTDGMDTNSYWALCSTTGNQGYQSRIRSMGYVNDNTVFRSTGYVIGGGSSESYCIPVEIAGANFK